MSALPHDRSTIEILDTHTGGEPTRVVLSGVPDLHGTSLVEKRTDFRDRYDAYRRAIVGEPRGSDVFVGALLLPPENADSVASVIFFNNIGYLGMCGHGMMGVAVALKELGRVDLGLFDVDTPVGTVRVNLLTSNRVELQNVTSFRSQASVPIQLSSFGQVTGDIAWGGNWFFLCSDHGVEVSANNLPELHAVANEIRSALKLEQITGARGAEIDHIELFGPASSSEIADSKSFVLCPGGAYDRSPCGTGTSAKVACLAADQKLAPGDTYRQESIIGSVFEATYQFADRMSPTPDLLGEAHVIPTLTGSAFVNGKSTFILDPADPFALGIE